MTSTALRYAGFPAWVNLLVIVGLYFTWASLTIINGYIREVTGWRHAGRPSRMHRVLWHWHTGLHLHPERTYGDENWRKRQLASGRSGVIYNPTKRWVRVLRNNGIIAALLLSSWGMSVDPEATTVAVTLLLFFGTVVWIALAIARKRAHIIQNRPPSSRPAWTVTKQARQVFAADSLTDGSRPKLVAELRPQLTSVPQTTLADLLSPLMHSSPAELVHRMHLSADRGELTLPNTFTALEPTRSVR
jgi:hypothetical protein